MSTLQSLPAIKNQTAFNLERWDVLCADTELARWPGRIETDRYGQIIMNFYADYSHGGRQFELAEQIKKCLPDGKVTVECPISTSEGVKIADVSWVSKRRLAKIGGRKVLKGAPEICVEVISASNTRDEIEEKRRLYFEAGAREVWICETTGVLRFFLRTAPGSAAKSSKLCPAMPARIAD